MIAAAHAQPATDSVKALMLAVVVHALALVLLTANIGWDKRATPQAVNVIKAVAITEPPARRPAAPPVKQPDDAARRQQVQAKRKAEALRKKKAAQKAAAKKKADLARRKAAAEKKRKAEAAARHKQAQQLLQDQLAAEEAERERATRLSAAQSKAAEFMARIGSRISSKWSRPPGSAKDAFAVLRVRVTAGGNVLSVSVVRSSGDPVFDRSIENAVYLAEPLPMPTDPDVLDLLREFNIDTEKL
jgi:colicin import membrane protein